MVYVRSVHHQLSHKPKVFLGSSIWLCWSSPMAASPISTAELSWAHWCSPTGLKWLVAFKHISPDMVVQRAEVRWVRRPFIFTNEFTPVGSNPVLSQLCCVCRHAVLLKDEARWQNRSAVLNKFRQQGFNKKFSINFVRVWNEMQSSLPPETDARRNHDVLGELCSQLPADVHRRLCESWWCTLRTYAKMNYLSDFCRAMLCISAAYAVMRCLSMCQSVCLSRSWVASKQIKISSKYIIFSPSDNQAILVFLRQTGWRYSDGNPPNGDVECRWGIGTNRDSGLIAGYQILLDVRSAKNI